MDAVADTVKQVEEQRWYGMVMLCNGCVHMVVVETQAVVGGKACVVGLRAQRGE